MVSPVPVVGETGGLHTGSATWEGWGGEGGEV